jgi:hypothetical protein
VDLSVAERELQLAVDGKLRTSNDRCVATAALAEIVSLSRDLDRASSLLDKAFQIPHNAGTAQHLEKIRKRIREANLR